LNDNHELKKARQALINRVGMKVLTRILFLYKIISLSGVKEYPNGIIELHDDIVSRQVRVYFLSDKMIFDEIFYVIGS
jgi:hypothetical protein